MKRLILGVAAISLLHTAATAHEGMWLPFKLKDREKDMRKMGLKISPDNIYSETQTSLKDAVVIFGGGCTGEVISNQGLVLTNHHCGYGTAQGLSTLKNDYLTDGYFAKSLAEEIPCPGLTVTFIVKTVDVTDKVLLGITAQTDATSKTQLIAKHVEQLKKEYAQETGYDIDIKSFYNDNKYYLYQREIFRDIRMVAFPPNSIGKFGGDTDNWVWPRHTGDFSVFRIYADRSNKAAAFSKDNVPYKPKKSFALNTGGIKEGDYTMVYGFPGRTTQYLSSYAVAQIQQLINPARITLRDAVIEQMDAAMNSSRDLFLKYAAKQSRLSNYYKKWKGENLGLERNNVVAYNQEQEKQFNAWLDKNADARQQYSELLPQLEKLYRETNTPQMVNEYFAEGVMNIELFRLAAMLDPIEKAVTTVDKDSLARLMDKMAKNADGIFKDYDVATDKNIALAVLPIYSKNLDKQYLPDWLAGANAAAISKWTNDVYAKTSLNSKDKLQALITKMNHGNRELLEDPAYKAYKELKAAAKDKVAKDLTTGVAEINKLNSLYMKAIMTWKPESEVYPDANSTLRISYGKVEGIAPNDGMRYLHYTTLDGVVQKNKGSQNDDFKTPPYLLELYGQKDYGNYAVNNSVPLAFLASNHTTGGNSGSPVLNAYGELIGTNFDRIWEGTMSDIRFDESLCRNITLDIRYTLFILDKYGKAGWLLKEMNINKDKR